MSGADKDKRGGKHNARHNANHKTKNIEKKPTTSKGFPWITGCFILFLTVCGALVVYDIQNSGSYEKSFTARGVTKALEHGSCALTTSLSAGARGYLWLEKNAPHYYSAVAEFSKPYLQLACDMWLLVTNQAKEMYSNMKDYAVEKWPIVHSTIDQYVPGLLGAVCEYSSTAWNATRNFTAYYYQVIMTYLTTKVFIDNWAPDVLHAKTAEALNTTQLYVVEYYKRFYKQVDHYSKL